MMNNSSQALFIPRYGQRALEYWQKPAVRTLLQVMLALGIGALAAVGKRFEPGLGIPGSSALLWLTPLVLGRALIRRDGAGVLMGLSVAVWGVPIGINHAFMHNLGLYGFTGLALDAAARVPRINITTWYGAVIGGALAHMVKFGYVFSAAYSSSITRHFLIVGVAQSAAFHLGFGIAAGLAGWAVFKGYRLVRSR